MVLFGLVIQLFKGMDMKKVTILSLMVLGVGAGAQIRNSEVPLNGAVSGTTAFLDASSSPVWNGSTNIAKGLVFPRTDLTTMTALVAPVNGRPTSFPTRLDGMIVYNTGKGTAATGTSGVTVEPGFYYYDNKTGNLNGGTWKPLGDTAAALRSNYWSLEGNAGTKEATVDASNNITAGNFVGTTDAKSVTVGTNNVARLTIGAKKETVGGEDFNFVLKVHGKAKFDQGIVTSASTYPDYVFDNYFTGSSKINPSYKFRTLAETEEFIKKNNHLPGVTKIDDLQRENGTFLVDNTILSIQSLEKVEELYLHTIEQQKQIDALKAEIETLKSLLRK